MHNGFSHLVLRVHFDRTITADMSRLLPLLLLFMILARPADAQQPDTSSKSFVRGTLYSLAGTVGPVAGGSALTYAAVNWESQGSAVFLRGAAVQVGGALVMGGLLRGRLPDTTMRMIGDKLELEWAFGEAQCLWESVRR